MCRLILWMLIILGFSACAADKVYLDDEVDRQLDYLVSINSPSGDLDHFILPNSTDFEAFTQEPANPLNAAKVELGRFLFFETGIGRDAFKPFSLETYSCGSCHLPSAGFRPGAAQGIADGGVGFGNNGELRTKFISYQPSELDAQSVRALSVLNVGFVTNTFWNGQFGYNDINEGLQHRWGSTPGSEVNHSGFLALEAQNIEGLHAHRMETNRETMEELGYAELYKEAFPEFEYERRFTDTTASFALSAYLRTLVSDEAPFQSWLKGDRGAMSDQQKRGAIVFFDKANCVSCHSGKSFSAMNFYSIGVNELNDRGDVFVDDPNDFRKLGRGGFTGRTEDLYKFKVPQLYNLGDAPFFFHGSSKHTIEEVVDYFDLAVPENSDIPAEAISPLFQPLNLSDEEKSDLVEFLRNGLRDPNLNRYMPSSIKSGNCFPNNDPFSQVDLNCN